MLDIDGGYQGKEIFETVLPKKNGTLLKTGKLDEYHDLWYREQKRTGITWKGTSDQYHYVVLVCPRKKVTNVTIFFHGKWSREFVGAGVAVRNPVDKYHEEAGIRLALTKALRSANMHRRGVSNVRI